VPLITTNWLTTLLAVNHTSWFTARRWPKNGSSEAFETALDCGSLNQRSCCFCSTKAQEKKNTEFPQREKENNNINPEVVQRAWREDSTKTCCSVPEFFEYIQVGWKFVSNFSCKIKSASLRFGTHYSLSKENSLSKVHGHLIIKMPSITKVSAITKASEY
jgi:hypothetical protein